ncbi:MAG TPA: hypothetical protein PLX37_05790 [Sedimentibacter sp.]|nr:hypothetical protein [Sedimentibacter sp.]HNZ82719.1 hypothetical protein [Sedimentibacter sp.]HOH69962.1 hypothetical protein [Sedimentibacter sp.]
MFFNKKRVEEDLDRIRRANLPNKNETNNKEETENLEKSQDDIRLEKGDMLAMVLAVISLVLPYILAFLGIMGIVVFLMYLFFK